MEALGKMKWRLWSLMQTSPRSDNSETVSGVFGLYRFPVHFQTQLRWLEPLEFQLPHEVPLHDRGSFYCQQVGGVLETFLLIGDGSVGFEELVMKYLSRADKEYFLNIQGECSRFFLFEFCRKTRG